MVKITSCLKIVLVLVLCTVCVAASAELRVKVAYLGAFRGNQQNRYEALFYKRAIETNGWDWYIRNFVLRKTVMYIDIVQQNDKHSLLIHVSGHQSDGFVYFVKKVFDRMAELNDSVCFVMNKDAGDMQKLRIDKKLRIEFFNNYLENCFWNGIVSTSSLHIVWVGDFFPCPGKSIMYGGYIVWTHMRSEDVKEEYERECAKRGFSPYPYWRETMTWGTKEERDLYRQYLEKNYDKIIAESLPEQSVDIGITYDKPKKVLFQVLTPQWVNDFGLNKSLWPK